MKPYSYLWEQNWPISDLLIGTDSVISKSLTAFRHCLAAIYGMLISYCTMGMPPYLLPHLQHKMSGRGIYTQEVQAMDSHWHIAHICPSATENLRTGIWLPLGRWWMGLWIWFGPIPSSVLIKVKRSKRRKWKPCSSRDLVNHIHLEHFYYRENNKKNRWTAQEGISKFLCSHSPERKPFLHIHLAFKSRLPFSPCFLNFCR